MTFMLLPGLVDGLSDVDGAVSPSGRGLDCFGGDEPTRASHSSSHGGRQSAVISVSLVITLASSSTTWKINILCSINFLTELRN